VGLAAIGRFAYSVMIWLLLMALLPMAWGWRPAVVSSGSMAPAIRPGDVLLSSPYDGGELAPGAVITYLDPVRGDVVAHRVLSVTEDGRYITRGDANPGADSTPVDPERIRAVGKMLVPFVGLPAHWLRTGNWPGVALFVAGVAAAVWLAHRGSLRRAWASRRDGFGLARRVAPVGMALVLLGTAAAPALAAFGDTTVNAGNSFASGSWAGLTLYLHNLPSPPTGDTASHLILPMDPTPASAATLYNYDTNRDMVPGLFVANGGSHSGPKIDPVTEQTWDYVVSAKTDFSGTGSLTLWLAAANFDPTVAGKVSAVLYLCDATGSACSAIGTGGVSASPISPSGTWTGYTMGMGSVAFGAGPGEILRLEIITSSVSGLNVAYDTTSYPAVLVLSS
jgi:signal peptidase I